jgi:Kef-type K+ transport system membrane component KefB
MQTIPMLTLAFSVLLVLGVLISERASRTVLSTAVLFLLGGFVRGQGSLDIVPYSPAIRSSASWPSSPSFQSCLPTE